MSSSKRLTKRVPARFLDLTSRLRGIYERVARRLHLDPSYVSRVARGERRSEAVKAALRERNAKSLGRKADRRAEGQKLSSESDLLNYVGSRDENGRRNELPGIGLQYRVVTWPILTQ